MKVDNKDKGGCSKNVNMHKNMHQSGTDNLSQTATVLIVQSGTDKSRPTAST